MISTHILDTTLGKTAKNVKVVLEIKDNSNWVKIGSELTNEDGRISFNCPAKAGDYRLIFHTQDYFKRDNREYFFLDTHIGFQILDISRKYHVPLLLNPFSLSSYRGS